MVSHSLFNSGELLRPPAWSEGSAVGDAIDPKSASEPDLSLQDHDLGASSQIGHPIRDQLAAARCDQAIADDRRGLLERIVLAVELVALLRA